MARSRTLDSLSVEELRNLLIEKMRSERRVRLEQYRRTGRMIVLDTNTSPQPLENLQSEVLVDPNAPAIPSRRRTLLDGALMLIEIAAVAGFLWIIFTFFSALNQINQEAAAALIQPTLEPTPIIQAVVLPGGHTPPLPGTVVEYDTDIPENLKPMQQAYASLPVPTPGLETAVRIQIPAINVDAPIVQGDGKDQLRKGVGQHIGTANPGQRGNVVLSAHNDIAGEIFRDLELLKPGDQIIVFTNQRTYTYIVSEGDEGKGYRLVAPTQVDVMAPSPEAIVTLISCYPYQVDNQRIIVKAYLQEQP